MALGGLWPLTPTSATPVSHNEPLEKPDVALCQPLHLANNSLFPVKERAEEKHVRPSCLTHSAANPSQESLRGISGDSGAGGKERSAWTGSR